MDANTYVHGYSESEARRLSDQARTLAGLLHHDTRYPDGSHVLEAGCGTGGQTITLAAQSPGAVFTCIDCSGPSLEKARARCEEAGLRNVSFQKADILDPPFGPGSFDHVFVCFVLEHLPDPLGALGILKGLIRPGGSLTVIEGDHRSAYFYPRSPRADKAIGCLVSLQAEKGGNALVGRELYPLLTAAGFSGVHVSPRMVYVDHSRPDLEEGFTRQTFTAMVNGVREEAVGRGLMSEEEWNGGISDLLGTCSPGGVFCYTFFKGVGLENGDE